MSVSDKLAGVACVLLMAVVCLRSDRPENRKRCKVTFSLSTQFPTISESNWPKHSDALIVTSSHFSAPVQLDLGRLEALPWLRCFI